MILWSQVWRNIKREITLTTFTEVPEAITENVSSSTTSPEFSSLLTSALGYLGELLDIFKIGDPTLTFDGFETLMTKPLLGHLLY